MHVYTKQRITVCALPCHCIIIVNIFLSVIIGIVMDYTTVMCFYSISNSSLDFIKDPPPNGFSRIIKMFGRHKVELYGPPLKLVSPLYLYGMHKE